MAKFYIDSNNNYLGAYEGAQPPIGSIEVPNAPKDARCKWDGSKWLDPVIGVKEREQLDLQKAGASDHDMIIALWNKVMNNDSTAADALKSKIDNEKAK